MVTTIADHKSRRAQYQLSHWVFGTASALMLVSISNAVAADWKIQPTAGIRETYSDNIKLAAQGSEKSDFVTEITPGVSITADGRDLKARINYAMQNLVYANNSSGNAIQNQLSADAHAVLIDDLFYWDGRASISQQNISPLGAQTNDNINDTGNRATVKTFTFTPYLRHAFASAAVAELRYSHDGTSTNTALANSNIDTALFKLDSGTAFKTLGWGMQANDQKTTYANNGQVEMRMASVNVSYRVVPRFRLIETVGYESNRYAWSGGTPVGRLWTSGFSWSPTDRTSISASAGRRFYGPTYSLSASLRSRTTVWGLGYAEDITTTQAQFSSEGFLRQYYSSIFPGMDPVSLQARIDADMRINALANPSQNPNNFFTNQVFLQKNLQGFSTFNSGKSSVTLSGHYTVRTTQTASTLSDAVLGVVNISTADKTKEAGASAQWNWKIFSRTSTSLTADFIRTSAPLFGGRSDIKRMTAGLTTQFQPKLEGSVGYRHVLQKSSQVIGPITEDAVFAGLLMRF